MKQWVGLCSLSTIDISDILIYPEIAIVTYCEIIYYYNVVTYCDIVWHNLLWQP